MIDASARILKNLAALIWYAGSTALFLKAMGLLSEAAGIDPRPLWRWVTVGIGLIIGSLKGRFIFIPFCRKNLIRIGGLKKPKIWQVFRVRFFILLGCMISTGAILSRLAAGHYAYLLIVAGLDLTIAWALLSSSFIFWSNEKPGLTH